MEAAAQALRDPSHNYLLHIDEINRSDLGKILGEAIFLLEPMANSDRKIDFPYDFGEPFHRTFFLPKNLHILGTMNSADRSIAIVDVAVRRRFAFVSLWPRMSVVEQHGCAMMQKAFKEWSPSSSSTRPTTHSRWFRDIRTFWRQMSPCETESASEPCSVAGRVSGARIRWRLRRTDSRLSATTAKFVTRSRTRYHRRAVPLVAPRRAKEVCLELEDHSVTQRSAIEFFQLRRLGRPTNRGRARGQIGRAVRDPKPLTDVPA